MSLASTKTRRDAPPFSRWLATPVVLAFLLLGGCECVDETSYEGWDVSWLSGKERPDAQAEGDFIGGFSIQAGEVRYYYEQAFLAPFGWGTSDTPIRVGVSHRPKMGVAGGYEYCSFVVEESPFQKLEHISGQGNFRFTLSIQGDEMRERCQRALDEEFARPEFQLDEDWDDWATEADFPDVSGRFQADYFNYTEVGSCD